MAATVDVPYAPDVHQTSPTSKPSPAQAACKYALTRSGSMMVPKNFHGGRDTRRAEQAREKNFWWLADFTQLILRVFFSFRLQSTREYCTLRSRRLLRYSYCSTVVAEF
jgi:hypothetical protein